MDSIIRLQRALSNPPRITRAVRRYAVPAWVRAQRKSGPVTIVFVCPLCGQHIRDGKPCGCGARRS